ncbi:MAG: HI0074 family nucleotidyltransferase substrate-binding subunit [Cytophagales bacterium]
MLVETNKNLFERIVREIHYPRDTIKAAFKVGIIDYQHLWLDMINDRNKTSHTYNQEKTLEIYRNFIYYIPLLRKLKNTSTDILE